MKAQRERIKLVAMEQITTDILGGPAASADYDFIYEEGVRLRDIWTEGSRVEITTPLGMDLEASIDGRNGYFAVSKVEQQPEGIDLYVASFPDGEASIAPIEGTANGTIVWDETMHELGHLDEPIEADVEDGYITEIRGGRQADQFRTFLEEMDHPDAYGVGEIAIGINPGARITGSPREDKKARGYLHLAAGENTDVGGTLEAPTHIDGVVGSATLTIDDTVVVEDGEIVA
jgi:leucyl aminopeptidase (aminopeptidase T)